MDLFERYYQPQAQRIPKEYRYLLLSTLQMAMDDLTRVPNLSKFNEEYRRIKMRDYDAYKQEALEWFQSDAESNGCHFTFIQICDFLGLDAKRIRQGLGL